MTVEIINVSGTWTVPAGVTSVQVEVIGGGGNGGTSGSSGSSFGGGAGGGYAKTLTVAVTPGNSAFLSIGGTATDTWFNANSNAAPSSTTDGALAKGGPSSTGVGGGVAATTGFVGDVIAFGGNGGAGSSSGASASNGGGGGGAGGLNGAGNPGAAATSTSNGGSGDAGFGGAGGAGGNPAVAGTNGTEWSIAGSGGGGGGGRGNGVSGADGGFYGGGGGGTSKKNGTQTGGTGQQGVIVLTYTAVVASVIVESNLFTENRKKYDITQGFYTSYIPNSVVVVTAITPQALEVPFNKRRTFDPDIKSILPITSTSAVAFAGLNLLTPTAKRRSLDTISNPVTVPRKVIPPIFMAVVPEGRGRKRELMFADIVIPQAVIIGNLPPFYGRLDLVNLKKRSFSVNTIDGTPLFKFYYISFNMPFLGM